jgi:hypothetical protein
MFAEAMREDDTLKTYQLPTVPALGKCFSLVSELHNLLKTAYRYSALKILILKG